jgi:uncharacterized repeat protein (TIGR03803 family)
MKKPTRPRRLIFGKSRGPAWVALGLALALVPAFVMAGSAQAQTYTYSLLYSFAGAPDGESPYAGLVMDAQGNFYGMTEYGGAYGWGTVFKVDITGKETVVYAFGAFNGDGVLPMASLVLDAEENLYGTTYGGGDYGHGTVFKVDITGRESLLYSFAGGTDGQAPYAGLVMDAQGNLYGTTTEGGAYSYGTVFKVDTSGKETVLHSFSGTGGDGASPYAGLVLDAQGNLYGTNVRGGDPTCVQKSGCGTVFKVDTTGKETVLHIFTSNPDGADPYAGLVLDAGNLYGTTESGGAYGWGAAFKVDASGNETVLHSFTGGTDGASPGAGFVLDANGSLYGTTNGGGAHKKGTIFMMDTSGNETVLYSLTAKNDQNQGAGNLVLDAQGSLFGAGWGGGAYKYGGVFALLSPAAATTTALTSAPNPSTYGEAVTFTAVVSGVTGAPPDGETVTFMKPNKRILGTATLSSGSASFTTSTLPLGTTSVKAVYGGDPHFIGGTSNTVKQVVKEVKK